MQLDGFLKIYKVLGCDLVARDARGDRPTYRDVVASAQ